MSFPRQSLRGLVVSVRVGDRGMAELGAERDSLHGRTSQATLAARRALRWGWNPA